MKIYIYKSVFRSTLYLISVDPAYRQTGAKNAKLQCR